MIKNRRVYALIPAKKNSKRLKNKNFLILTKKKKSLVEMTALYAKNSKYIDEIFISSDNKKILYKSKKLGVKVRLRPKAFCRSTSKASDVIKDFITSILKKKKDLNSWIIYLQPTSPNRTTRHINDAFKLLIKKKKNSLISITDVDKKFWKNCIVKKNLIYPLFKKNFFLNYQELRNAYRHNGAIYIFKTKEFLKKFNIPSKNSLAFYMNSDSSVDIDCVNDLKYIK